MDDSESAPEEERDRGTDEPETDSVQDAAEQRQHERAETVEDVLADVREDLGNRKYPVSSEELSTVYADRPIDLPNETESLGSVFRRIDETFDDEGAAYDAVVTELEGEEMSERSGAETATWSEERAETQHEFGEGPIPDEAYESSVERSQERAREAQAASDERSDGEVDDGR